MTSSGPNAICLAQGEIDVVADLENAVACRDSRQRDEADHAGDGQRLTGQRQRRDRTDQRQRHAAHDDRGQHGGAVAAVENGEDQRERND